MTLRKALGKKYRLIVALCAAAVAVAFFAFAAVVACGGNAASDGDGSNNAAEESAIYDRALEAGDRSSTEASVSSETSSSDDAAVLFDGDGRGSYGVNASDSSNVVDAASASNDIDASNSGEQPVVPSASNSAGSESGLSAAIPDNNIDAGD